jgi:hypothetical protein
MPKTPPPKRGRGRPSLFGRPLTPAEKSARYHQKKREREGRRALSTYVLPQTLDLIEQERSEGETSGDVVDRWASDRAKF